MEGRFNGRFFALPVWGAYIWRGLLSEFYGIETQLISPIDNSLTLAEREVGLATILGISNTVNESEHIQD